MQRALALTRRGLGFSSPNPAVGAVVVADGRMVGQGWHAKAGTPHAEVHALAQAGEAARGATIYVTLEPCHHQGRTPPCTKAILEAGIGRVVYGASDPNPAVAGGGGEFLAGQGVEVVPNLLAEACEREHRFFLTHITKARPHVILKTAATLDGKTATATGHSRWITGPASRRFVHRLRGWVDAIMVGMGTALADDPELTCRLPKGNNPLRVVVDSRLRLPGEARVLDPEAPPGCLVACGPEASAEDEQRLQKAGAQVLRLPAGPEGGVDLNALLSELGARGITSLLAEGGAGLAWSLLDAGLVDEVMYFHAPKIVGGLDAPPMVAGPGARSMDQAFLASRPLVRRFGDDVMLWARLS
ncbi:MAG: bifunctional diaminohydroxyphosphoribosylaminopyrimidine deaminase/5-amino-6-(5-phosphoribosylamino)uracil reductase RibD [Desulfarculaceae bacterium]|nr:bifunctional diaminohydroxyphosphoribosylaminopyrimidine deaminase/5-amino-6-(5-phosphoribosylamino)uracil reductase RibD [Desulfarculaceae bacterium]MCF8101408.1 bifunctional diaminohydroxyphosphoribosylaminopyrimidine deaminase/5-amino-6-(5-phosphoribosylamino)uracil reductase RibD [Desulfarculaceae bacterium]